MTNYVSKFVTLVGIFGAVLIILNSVAYNVGILTTTARVSLWLLTFYLFWRFVRAMFSPKGDTE
ncbi:MAG: hypothetical protein NZT61_01940 [Deltaproteobacteria bacterium]|nr:hypothetical protein [Deltaproteobacteria bacterium]MCX7953278.1 hypothetical protein [Deltaproteobacteria bacterium]